MRVQLKNVKYAAFASQETHCFSATVYVDGKKVGEVSNDGNGGCNSTSPGLDKAVAAVARTDPARVAAVAEFHADHEGADRHMADSLLSEFLISDLITRHLLARDVARWVKTRAFFLREDGTVGETKKLTAGQLVYISTPEGAAKAVAQLKAVRMLTSVDEIVDLVIKKGA